MTLLDQVLADATSGFPEMYFQLPVSGQNPIYRERVYCYELYHRLRSVWPKEWPYLLNGEIDKQGHSLLRRDQADRCKPDLLVHQPGCMSNNLAVIEVKADNAKPAAIQKDINTLALFTQSQVGYKRGIYLIYGHNAEQMSQRVRSAIEERPDTGKIEVWLHPSPSQPAYRQSP